MIPQWNSGLQQMIDKINGDGGFQKTFENAMKSIDDAMDEFAGKIT